jgi:hypothetical protein
MHTATLTLASAGHQCFSCERTEDVVTCGEHVLSASSPHGVPVGWTVRLRMLQGGAVLLPCLDQHVQRMRVASLLSCSCPVAASACSHLLQSVLYVNDFGTTFSAHFALKCKLCRLLQQY